MVAYNLPNKAPISELKGFRKAKSKNLKMNFWAFSFNSRILHTKNRSCLVKYQTKVTTSQGLYLVLHFSHFGYIIRTIFFLLLYKARKYKSKNRLKSFSKNLTFEIPIEFKIGSAFSFIIPTRKKLNKHRPSITVLFFRNFAIFTSHFVSWGPIVNFGNVVLDCALKFLRRLFLL